MKIPHYNLTIITSKNTNFSLVKKLEESGLENPPYEECSQYWIPSRTFDLWDLGADFVGVALFSQYRRII